MKTISKVAALAMTLALAGALSACGSSASSSAAASSAAASSSSAAASSAAASSSAASASASAANASTTSPSAEKADLYKNEFFGIEFELPEGWTFTEQSALSSANEQIAAIAQGSEIDMIAKSSDGTSMVMVAIESPTAENAGQTAEAHLGAEVEHMTTTATGVSSYESTGATIDFGNTGRSIPATVTHFSANGSEVWICQACADKEGHFLDITAIGPSEEAVTSTFSNFVGTAQ